MGALYEDVEKFFGDIFAVYGRFLARHPVVFIILSSVISCLLGLGLVNLEYENRVEKLYAPMGSPAFKDQARLARLFPDRTSKVFYAHQQLFLETFGEIVITPLEDDGNNVFTKDIIDELFELYEDIVSIALSADDRGHMYSDLCAARNGVCVADGAILLEALGQNSCLDPNTSFPLIKDTQGRTEDMKHVLSGINTEGRCIQAKAMRLRFNLRHDTARQRDLSMLWEEKFLSVMHTYEPKAMHITYMSSESLDIELNEHVGKDTKFFACTIIIMILYATFVSTGGNMVSTRILLAYSGVLAALLAILASFGLMSMCGMKFVDICGVMPFLVLGVGVDDMFILMSGWRQTDHTLSIEERTAETFRTSAISVTITSLTDLLAFCIGATSPFLSVKNFCVYAGVAVFMCYINQLTFFGGCLVLHARRVNAGRHCVTCLKTRTRAEMEEDPLQWSRAHIICCSGQPPQKAGEDDSLCERIPSSFMPKVLLQGPTKTLVIIGFIVYLGVTIWGASKIKTGLKLENVVPTSSYLSEYIEMEQKYFQNQGPYVMFVMDIPQPYHDQSTQVEIEKVLDKAQQSGYLDKEFIISWLHEYLRFIQNISKSEETIEDESKFISILKNQFLVQYPEYENDILFNAEGTAILASRFYVLSLRFQDSSHEGDMMIKMRKIATNSTLSMIAYSPQFIYYEHYVSILKNTLLAVGVAIIGMLFIALMFIPHPISVTCVTITMVTIVLGMFGFMHFWGLALSAVTTVQIILSVGFCVDFTVHISHAFMTATGKNRNERVMVALEKVGVPILNGALSSILGILMLAFASSYIFTSFFKTMLLVIVLGLAHSVLLLPVMLSFIGPRRTNKPRVFIPISASSRMGDGAPYRPRYQRPQTPQPSAGQAAGSERGKSPPGGGAEQIELTRVPTDGEAQLLDISTNEEPRTRTSSLGSTDDEQPRTRTKSDDSHDKDLVSIEEERSLSDTSSRDEDFVLAETQSSAESLLKFPSRTDIKEDSDSSSHSEKMGTPPPDVRPKTKTHRPYRQRSKSDSLEERLPPSQDIQALQSES